ncbi:uncharacterized protein RJT20DRAFT_125036 [Scheffersomyces xylosifermentans]|uniref:uncharacterized protein n=1 Tax=Scheffersomyces xylosifermentans TaxID=1304137 RepID=UPI00315CEE74
MASSDENSATFYVFLAVVVTPLTVFITRKYKIKKQSLSRNLSPHSKNVFPTIAYILLVLVNFGVWYKAISSWAGSSGNNNLSGPHTFNLLSSPISPKISERRFEKMDISGFSTFEGSHKSDCSQSQYIDRKAVSVSTAKKLNYPHEMKFIRDIAKKLLDEGSYPVLKYAFDDGPMQTESDILKHKWYKISGSAVWLDKYEVYLMVSRVFYSAFGARHRSTISFLYGEVYDRDWNQLRYKFDNMDLVFPTIFPADVDFQDEVTYLGPEDPHVVLREFKNPKTGKVDQEPVITFAQRSKQIMYKQAMHVYRPFTDIRKIVRFTIEDTVPKLQDKSWGPFMDEDKNFINFIYTFSPFRVIKCNIESGECTKITGDAFFEPETHAKNEVGALRGGSNLVQIPENVLPLHLAKTRKYWFGFGRSHSGECGCAREVFRPNGVLISRPIDKEGDFSFDYVTTLLDFNIQPELWIVIKSDNACDNARSVLTPGSLASWDFVDKSDFSFGARGVEDVMAITLSEADNMVKVVQVRGFLNHILKFLNGDPKSIERHYSKTDELSKYNSFLAKCSIYLFAEYCDLRISE